MFYQKEEENEEEISQNQSSEEFRVLTENNHKLKNEISFQKDSITHNSDKNLLIYNDKPNKNIYELLKKEEKEEIQDFELEKEKIELNNENENDNLNLNYEQKKNNDKTVYQPYFLNNENNKYNENEKESNISNEINLDNKNEIKNIGTNYTNKEEKKNPNLNFSYLKNEDYINNLIDNKNNKKETENNNNIYNDDEENIDFNKISFNEKKYNNIKNNYNDENIINEKNDEIENNFINSNNNKIDEKYNAFLNKENNLIKNEFNDNNGIIYEKNEENIFIEEENSNNINGKDIIKVNKLNKSKNEKETDKKDKLIYQINEENNNLQNSTKSKNFYYFNYDNSINLRNYYPIKSGKTDYSTEQNTINKNYSDYKNIDITDFNEVKIKTIDHNKNISEKNIQENETTKNKKDYSNNYINFNSKIENELKLFNNLVINNNENNNNINKNIKKEKYLNDINNVNIYNTYEKNKLQINSEKIPNNYGNIPEINSHSVEISKNISNANTERSVLNNKKTENINLQENKKIIEIPESNLITKTYKDSENTVRHMNDESMNLNTLESVNFRKIDEEEEKRTVEIEQETKRLNELEQEKMKLILEEQERRQKILEEIERQENKEKERKKKMRQKYEESIKKKKEDEEKLRQIRIEQEKQRKEINELIYKRKMDEENILLLAEGKLNRQQRKNYRNLIRNETCKNKINKNKLPFDIYIKDKNNFEEKENILKKMKTNYIDKDFKFWNLKESNDNNDNNNKNGFRKQIIKNKKISYDNFGNKLYRNFNNLNSNESTINYDKMNSNKNDKVTFNTMSKINEFMSLSPTSIHQKINYSLSPPNDKEKNNKLNTELHPEISFANNHIEEKKEAIKENKNNLEFNNNDLKNSTLEEKIKTLYQKKLKKNYKNINISIHKHIDNSYDKNNHDNKNIKIKGVPEINKEEKKYSINKNSFSELKEVKEMTSKMANEINKKIETINKGQKIAKAKSTPKFNPYIKYNKNFSYYSLNKENKNFKKEKELKNREENKKLNNKYIKLVKESKIELSNIINNETNKEEKEKKITKQKSFIEDYLLPNDIKRECLLELNKLEKNGKKSNNNFENNLGIFATSREHKALKPKVYENINKNKKGKSITNYKKEKYETNKENKNYNIGNQKAYYKEFLYGSEKGSMSNYFNENFLSENNSRFLPYYKEIYG